MTLMIVVYINEASSPFCSSFQFLLYFSWFILLSSICIIFIIDSIIFLLVMIYTILSISFVVCCWRQRRIWRLNRFRQRRRYGDHIYRDIPMLLKGNEEYEGWIHFEKEGDMKIIYLENPDTSSVDEEIIKYVFDQHQQDIQWSRIPRIMYLICFKTSGCVASNEEMASCLEFRRGIYNIFTTTCPVDRKSTKLEKAFWFPKFLEIFYSCIKVFFCL